MLREVWDWVVRVLVWDFPSYYAPECFDCRKTDADCVYCEYNGREAV